jgi:hypothetical protein
MHCVGCGTELRKDQKYCPSCGMEMGSSTDSSKVENNPKITTSPRVVKTITTSPRRTGRKIFVILLIIAIVGSGIFGIVTMANWGVMEGNDEFFYENASPSSVESLLFDVGTSDIIINYVNSPSAPVVEIQMDYHVEGGFVAGKTFDEIFDLSWDNSSVIKRFYLHVKLFAGWVMVQNTNIIVTLRSDVIYDIEVSIWTGDTELNILDDVVVDEIKLTGITGSMEINAGSNVTFQGITARVTTGGISITAEDSIFTSYIVVTSTTGRIELNLHDSQYLSDQTWDLTTTTGDIDVVIYQSKSMMNDISGDLQSTTGDITVNYNGNLTTSGASFDSSIVTGDYDYVYSGGFMESNSLFKSIGYDSAANKYTFTLTVITGAITVTGVSL